MRCSPVLLDAVGEAARVAFCLDFFYDADCAEFLCRVVAADPDDAVLSDDDAAVGRVFDHADHAALFADDARDFCRADAEKPSGPEFFQPWSFHV